MSFDTLGTIKSATGLGSGLDITSIVSQIVAAEGKFKQDRIILDQGEALAKITGFGNLKSSLSSFRDSLKSLKEPAQFQTRKTTIVNDPTTLADTTYFSALSITGTAASSYTIEVEQLAQAHKLGRTFADANKSFVVGTGTIKLTVGAGQPNTQTFDIAITSDDQTVEGIAAAINNRTSSSGVSATVVTLDAGVQLVISANIPGVAKTLDIAVIDDADGNDVDDSGLSQLITANQAVLAAPQDSLVKIDGQLVTTSSNTLVDVISGVVLELEKAEDGKIHTLKVEVDKTAATVNVNKFVEDYNGIVDVINELTKFNILDPEKKGDLFADPTVRLIANTLRTQVVRRVIDPTGFSSLASIGITSDEKTGKLKIDQTKLNGALDTNFDAVGNLFGLDDGANQGIALSLFTKVDGLITTGGTIPSQTESLTDDLTQLNKDQVKLNTKLDRLEVELTLKFAALDALLGQLQLTSNQLSLQLEQIKVDPLSFRK